MEEKDIRDAVAFALTSYEGEPVYIEGSNIVVGMDSEIGRYWLVDNDNGDEVDGLDYDGVLEYCLGNLS